ncbi:MAG: efflux RND transporter periplasmic adaptor subunit [Acidobacteria bacterium]|nr:efflux RND transporter periplasmic adaptor subunit [Acidobacteriota bacterium]
MRFDASTVISADVSPQRWLRSFAHVAACLGTVLALSACRGAAENAQAATATADESRLVSVATAVATEQEIPTVVQATGGFVADETFQVTPQVAGQIAETLVNVGDAVQAGQILFRLDSRDASLRLDQARASLKQAEASAARTREDATRRTALQAKGLVARSEADTLATQAVVADAAVTAARAQVAIAEKAVDDTTVRTSLSGYVSARSVSVGEYVAPSSRVATVIRIQPLKLELRVPEAQAMTLRIGMPVRAEVSAYSQTVFDGFVSALNRAIDPASRAMTAEARFANQDGRLTPGMFATAHVRLPLLEKAVFVPTNALHTIVDGTSYGVFAVESGSARLLVVQAGDRVGDKVRIDSGLRPGTVVAVGKLDQLYDGARVATVSEGPQTGNRNDGR